MGNIKEAIMEMEHITDTPIDVLVLENNRQSDLFDLIRGVNMPVHIPVRDDGEAVQVPVRSK